MSGPSGKMRALVGASAAAIALSMQGCAGISYTHTEPGQSVRVGNGGIAVGSRNANGTHNNTTINAQQTCVSGGGKWNTNTGVCVSTKAVTDLLGGILRGATQSQPTGGGTTPAPLAPEAAKQPRPQF